MYIYDSVTDNKIKYTFYFSLKIRADFFFLFCFTKVVFTMEVYVGTNVLFLTQKNNYMAFGITHPVISQGLTNETV